MYDNDVMNYLLAAEELGMVNGDYVYFGLDIDGSNAALHPTAYDGFISANVKVPSGSEWDSFASEVITGFSDAKFNGFDHTDDASEVSGFWTWLNDF